MTIEYYIYIGLAVYFTAIIIHAFTRVYAPPIVYEVGEVKEIVRHTFESYEFTEQFIIDETELARRRYPIDTVKEREFRIGMERLFHEIPIDMFEYISWDDYSGQYGVRKIYSIKLTVLPPKKR